MYNIHIYISDLYSSIIVLLTLHMHPAFFLLLRQGALKAIGWRWGRQVLRWKVLGISLLKLGASKNLGSVTCMEVLPLLFTPVLGGSKDEWWWMVKSFEKGLEFGFLTSIRIRTLGDSSLLNFKDFSNINHWGIGLLRVRCWSAGDGRGMREATDSVESFLSNFGQSARQGAVADAAADKRRQQKAEVELMNRLVGEGHRVAWWCFFERDKQEDRWNEFEFLFPTKRGWMLSRWGLCWNLQAKLTWKHILVLLGCVQYHLIVHSCSLSNP